jgi:hypothetical protein
MTTPVRCLWLRTPAFYLGTFLLFALVPSVSYTNEFSARGYFESGEKNTVEDSENNDYVDDYHYAKYNLVLKKELSKKVNYRLGYYTYDNDYNTQKRLSNTTRILSNRMKFAIVESDERRLSASCDIKYAEKKYDLSSSNDYDRYAFSAEVGYDNALWSWDFSGGIDNYVYSGEHGNQFEKATGISLGRKFLDDAAVLTGFYRVERADTARTDRFDTKQTVGCGLDWRPEGRWKHFSVGVEDGRDNTRSSQELDDDYDFSYRKLNVKIACMPVSGLDGTLKIEAARKDYLGTDLDSESYKAGNDWKLVLFDNEIKRVTATAGYEYRDSDYDKWRVYSHTRNSATAGCSYEYKKGLSLSGGIRADGYDYQTGDLKDKNDYSVFLSARKPTGTKGVVLSMNLRHKLSDYEEKSDTTQTSVRFSFESRF